MSGERLDYLVLCQQQVDSASFHILMIGCFKFASAARLKISSPTFKASLNKAASFLIFFTSEFRFAIHFDCRLNADGMATRRRGRIIGSGLTCLQLCQVLRGIDVHQNCLILQLECNHFVRMLSDKYFPAGIAAEIA